LGVGPTSSGGGGCTQATNFLARTSGESSPTQAAITAMLCGLNSDLLLSGSLSGAASCGSTFDRMFIHFLENSTDALLDVCGSGTGSGSGVATGSPTYTTKAGFTGVDSSLSVFIDTGLNIDTPNTVNFTLSSAHVAQFLTTNPIGASFPISTGAQGVSLYDTAIFPHASDGNTIWLVNSTTSGGIAISAAAAPGMWVGNRPNGTTLQGYMPGHGIVSGTAVSGTDAVSTSTAGVGDFYELATNDAGGANNGSGAQVAFTSYGRSLSSGEITSLYNRVCTAIHTINPTLVPTC
jgi:hypothetical protein